MLRRGERSPLDRKLSDLQQEYYWRQCAKDPVFFIENCVRIRVPGRGVVPFKLRESQREMLRAWTENRYVIVLKARQIGFSTLIGAYCLWLLMFRPGMFIIMVSKTEREAKKLQAKVKLAYKYLPSWLKAKAPNQIENSQQRMAFANDSIIESLPAEEGARGDSADLVIIDEWAFLPNPEEAWASIEPVTDIGGRVIGGSTANGWGNFFHTMYVDAKSGKSQFKAVFFPYSAVDERDDDWYELKKGTMLPWQLHQEYPRNDVECFVKSGMTVFDHDAIHNEDQHPIEIPKRGILLPVADRVPEFSPTENGPLRVWRFPEPGHAYVVGADVAEGLEHGDYSCAHVIDTATDEVVAKWHGHIDADLFGTDILWHLGWWYNCALVGVEVNNFGLTTLTHLQAKVYPNIYYRITYDERTQKRLSKIGWRTQANTKPLMIGDLAKALRDEIRLYDEETMAELDTYVRDESGKMSGSPYDDQVMSLAIANQMRKHQFTPVHVEQRAHTGTWGAVIRRSEGDGARFRIGERNRRQPLQTYA